MALVENGELTCTVFGETANSFKQAKYNVEHRMAAEFSAGLPGRAAAFYLR